MPFKSFSREQDWLLPPSLGELIPDDHPVRFVAEFVDSLDWAQIGIRNRAEPYGAPAYAPALLLAAWLYGFMTRTRSTRQIERACREHVPMMWLTGLQRPDHSTLARFYQANRPALRRLFQQTVYLAIDTGLVDFALQAVDGTRLAAASPDSVHTRAEIERLLRAVEHELDDMEAAQTAEDNDAAPPPGPRTRVGREQVRARLQQALAELERRAALPGRNKADAVSRSDPEAALQHTPSGFVTGYNAQAVVDAKAQIVVAADVSTCSSDRGHLAPMLAEAHAMTGRHATAVVADKGYFAMSAICDAQQTGIAVCVPQPAPPRARAGRYTKPDFVYDPDSDTYRCPEGQVLTFAGVVRSERGKPVAGRTYRGRQCAGCPAKAAGRCTSKPARVITRYAHDADLPAYLEQLRLPLSRQRLRQRKAVVEPLFANTKQRLGMLRFGLVGWLNAKAEWWLTCTAYNLLKLWRQWWQPDHAPAPCAT